MSPAMNPSERPNSCGAHLRCRRDLSLELVIPTGAPRRQCWWLPGGQRIRATLLELHADQATLDAYDPELGIAHLGSDYEREEEL
ncbi:MAG: hypothetical protein ABH877_05920 [bacterium]